MNQQSLFDKGCPLKPGDFVHIGSHPKCPQDTREAYPNHPGFKARATSEDAADAISPKAETLRSKVFRLIELEPRTADECAEILEETPFAVRPRLTELSKLGKIEDSGERRKNRSGIKAIVWTLSANQIES